MPPAKAGENPGAVIHPIIEPVLSPDETAVVGKRRVGAIGPPFYACLPCDTGIHPNSDRFYLKDSAVPFLVVRHADYS